MANQTQYAVLHPLTHIDLLSLQPALKLGTNARSQTTVFDPVRRRFIQATPEEVVRQLWIVYFLQHLHWNPKLIAVEREISVHGLRRRFDMVIYDRGTSPVLLAEFKAPDVSLGQLVFDQVARYNMQLHVPYALVSNGSYHYCFQIDADKEAFVFLDKLPF